MMLFWTQRAVILIHLYHMLLHIMNDVGLKQNMYAELWMNQLLIVYIFAVTVDFNIIDSWF